MGTWGYGNLENDGAQDLIADISDELFGRVVTLLKSPSAAEFDESDYYELFVRIEMILALEKHGMINSSPVSTELESLFGPFVERWYQYFISSNREAPEERRAIIVETFSKLLEVTGRAADGSFARRLNLISQKMGENKRS